MTESWMARGRCRTEPPSLFFPSDGVGVEIARRICADCPVKAACLEYALRNGIDHGVWGGTSERERRRIARRRRLAAEAAREPVPDSAR
jgi:WhiB family transcriptional regulator, redox-sensing transcriptional regulator